MRRSKTGLSRYGLMRPMVWLHFQEYLKKSPKEENELLFVTGKGNPVVWVRAKTEDEIKNGTSTSGPSQTPFKRCDSLSQAWNKLKERAGLKDWKEGFYLWRHLGATAYASRPGTGIAQLRTFLGHGKSNVADEYMKPLTPEIKDVVRWVNQMLDSDDLNAWRKK
jgi:integrase